MKCGIIMQITSSEITVLTPEGEFIKLNKERNDYQIGEEITLDINESKPVVRMKSGWKVKTIVSTLAAIFLLIVSFIPSLFMNSKVSAYVSMDVKSSIEIGVTEELKVVEVKGINQEGKQIISLLKEWKGRDMDDVIEEMIALNHSAGHFQTNHNILFSTVLIENDNHNLEQSLQRKLDGIKEIPQIEESVKVEMKKASVKDREEASDKGVSTGTYLEQTNKKTKNNSSSGAEENEKNSVTEKNPVTEKNSVIEKNPVTEKTSNQIESNHEKVKIKPQLTSNNEETTPIPNSQAFHENKKENNQKNKQKVFKESKKEVTVSKDPNVKQKNSNKNAVKREEHKGDKREQEHPDKKIKRDKVQKEKKTSQNKREMDRKRQKEDKHNNHNQKDWKRQKEDKHNNHNQKPRSYKGPNKEEQGRGDKQDVRKQYQKRHGDHNNRENVR